MFQNCKYLFKDRVSIFIIVFSFVLFFGVIVYFTDKQLVCGNFGCFYFWTELVIHIFLSILFAIFIAVQIYKIKYFNEFSTKKGVGGFFGSFFGIIITGCPSCSITIASYIGLGSLVTLLPFGGIELKIIGLLLLLYSTYNLCKTMNVCSLLDKNKKTSKKDFSS